MELATTGLTGARGRISLSGTPGEYIFDAVASKEDFYERDVLDLLATVPVAGGATVIDVGANLGNHTLYFCDAFDADVISIEPQESNFAKLRHNVAANGFDGRVRLVAAAAWSEPGRLALHQRIEGNSGSFYAGPDDSDPSVEAVRLDDLVQTGVDVALIKVDVEGGELHVLEGARRILEERSPTLCIEAHGVAAAQATLAFLLPLGYELVDVRGRSDNLILVHPERVGPAVTGTLRTLASAQRGRGDSKDSATRTDRVARAVKRIGERAKGIEDRLASLDAQLAAQWRGDVFEEVLRGAEARAELVQARNELQRVKAELGAVRAERNAWRDAYMRLWGSRVLRIVMRFAFSGRSSGRPPSPRELKSQVSSRVSGRTKSSG